MPRTDRHLQFQPTREIGPRQNPHATKSIIDFSLHMSPFVHATQQNWSVSPSVLSFSFFQISRVNKPTSDISRNHMLVGQRQYPQILAYEIIHHITGYFSSPQILLLKILGPLVIIMFSRQMHKTHHGHPFFNISRSETLTRWCTVDMACAAASDNELA